METPECRLTADYLLCSIFTKSTFSSGLNPTPMIASGSIEASSAMLLFPYEFLEVESQLDLVSPSL